MRKLDLVLTLLGVAFMIVVGVMVYYNWGYLGAKEKQDEINENISMNLNDSFKGNQTSDSQEIPQKKHIPIILNQDDVLVSFRIDDITFKTGQRQVLENALFLVGKYNITFDLAVIAQPFNENADPEVFKIFEENQDVFEVVAHGWDHKHYNNDSKCDEFSCAPYDYQEEHIKKMKDVFEKKGLSNYGSKIFLLSWHSGDNSTINIANRYGYKLMTQTFVPNKSFEYVYRVDNKDTIVSRNWVSIVMDQTITEKDIISYKKSLYSLINDKTQTRIQIVMHPINFYKIENSEELIKQITKLKKENSKIKFSMISDRLGE